MIFAIPLAKERLGLYTVVVTIFERIREAQGRYNLTQAQFAQIAGIRETYMSQIMNAEPDLRLSTYTKLETALKVLEAGAAAR